MTYKVEKLEVLLGYKVFYFSLRLRGPRDRNYLHVKFRFVANANQSMLGGPEVTTELGAALHQLRATDARIRTQNPHHV